MVTKHELDFGYTNDNKLNWGKRQEAHTWKQASGGEKRTDGYEEEVVEEEEDRRTSKWASEQASDSPQHWCCLALTPSPHLHPSMHWAHLAHVMNGKAGPTCSNKEAEVLRHSQINLHTQVPHVWCTCNDETSQAYLQNIPKLCAIFFQLLKCVLHHVS